MKKYIYYTMIIINIGIFYYFTKTSVVFSEITEIESNLIWNTVYTAVTYFIPISMGTEFLIAAKIVSLNICLGMFVIIFIYPFIFVTGGRKR